MPDGRANGRAYSKEDDGPEMAKAQPDGILQIRGVDPQGRKKLHKNKGE